MTSSDAPVCILLAVYNGEAYLREQLASIEAQTAEWTMIAADDGSTDRSLSILEEFAERHECRVRIVSGPQTGRPQDNFFELLKLVDHAAYVALCDQDDLWRSDKLEVLRRECGELEQRVGSGRPCLVYSDLSVVDQNDRLVADSFWAQTRVSPLKATFGSVLVENISPGCAMLLNPAMVSKFKEFSGELQSVIMHDWWLMLISQALGASSYVDEQLVRYRQHAANAAGTADRSGLVHVREKILQSRRPENTRTSQQARLFAIAYGSDLDRRHLQQVRAMSTVSEYSKPRRIYAYIRYGLLKQGLDRRVFQFLKM